MVLYPSDVRRVFHIAVLSFESGPFLMGALGVRSLALGVRSLAFGVRSSGFVSLWNSGVSATYDEGASKVA